uniref:Uncharacterized protein n=1 Tax=Arundo donax TaxID=35708 RepID=A0A0A9FW22_ARUDO
MITICDIHASFIPIKKQHIMSAGMIIPKEQHS